jgi:ATP-binding cassette subfamily B protein
VAPTGRPGGLWRRRPALDRLARAVGLVWRSSPAWTLASGGLLLVQGVLPLASLYLVKLVVDAVAAGLAAPGATGSFSRVAVLIGWAAAVAILGALCRALGGLVNEAHTQVVADTMFGLLHAKSVAVDFAYYEDPRYHDTLHRAQQDASFRPARITSGLLQVAQNGVGLLAMGALLVAFHWTAAAVVLLSALPGVWIRARFAGRVHEWQRGRTPDERRAWYFHWMLTTPIHAKEIRAFGLGPLFMERFRDIRARLRGERVEMAARRAGVELAAHVGMTLAVFAVYGLVAYRAVHGVISVGDLVMYYQAFQRGQDFLRETLGGIAGLYEDQLFLAALFEFLDLKPKTAEAPSARAVPRPITSGIVFDGVALRYPGGRRNAVEGISLTIRPGECVALVGENGSGKTTLIKLLCRLYDPTAGAIRIDGIDLREFSSDSLRREIGVIFQDFARYNLTARENIWLGNVALPSHDPRVIDAARRSGADEVIEAKGGYDAILGKWLDEGEELSAGEWQKVALARAFLRDAQVIVLDEPTSALDARAEYEVFSTMRRLSEGRTTIVISHRFSTVKDADRIVVLEAGRIAESGDHDQLIRLGGRYARLFETQAQYYR